MLTIRFTQIEDKGSNIIVYEQRQYWANRTNYADQTALGWLV